MVNTLPVVPIYFHGHNSTLFTILGMIDWRLRTLKLPNEVFRSQDKTFRISVGDIIPVSEQEKYDDIAQLGTFLRNETYKMKQWN